MNQNQRLITFVLLALGLVACGPSQMEADEALNQARDAGRLLETDGAARTELFEYSTNMSRADNAYQNEDYELVIGFSKKALVSAERKLKWRKDQAGTIQGDFKKLSDMIANIVSPRPDLIDKYFIAKAALEAKDYTLAADATQDALKSATLELRVQFDTKVLLRDLDGERNRRTIEQQIFLKMYENLTQDGKLVQLKATIPSGTNGEFISAHWVDASKRYVRVRILVHENSVDRQIEGWIEGTYVF